MKTRILFFSLVLCTLHSYAATYYFSSSTGNNSRTVAQAQNPATPWKTIQKLNNTMYGLNPGDSVLFKCGDTFDLPSTGLIVSVSGTSSQPITFGSYGTGAKPIFNGFSLASGWTQVRSNVWEAPFTQPAGHEKMVIWGGKQVGIGRYPNTGESNGGYLTIDSHSGTTQITSSSLSSSPDWTGADVVYRPYRWSLDRGVITSQSGSTLTFVNPKNDIIQDKYGFFIVNSTKTLDQNGEWFYDNDNSKLQMFSNQGNPGTYTVQASKVETLVTIASHNFITFTNISLIGANLYAFQLTSSNNITIENCNINFTGMNAVDAINSDYFTLQYSNISNTNNNGTNLSSNCNHALIQYDTVKNTALIAGMGDNGGWGYNYQGLLINGTNNLIQNCEVDSTGDSGIHYEGDYTIVQHCFVNTFGLTLDDCGGIYTVQSIYDSVQKNSNGVLYNTVVNGIGAGKGTDDSTSAQTNGIYFDDFTNHAAARNNTVANCNQSGFFAHNANSVGVLNNTFFNNGKEQFLGVKTHRGDVPSDITFYNNICFSKTALQLASQLDTYNGGNDLSQIGNFDSNFYCRPLDNYYMFYNLWQTSPEVYPSIKMTLSDWQASLGIDLHSSTSPATISPFTASNLGSNLLPNGSFTSNVHDYTYITSSINDVNATRSSNKLNSGTLQVTANNYSSNSFYINLYPASNTQRLIKNQKYLLNLTVLGASSGSGMNVSLLKGGANNGSLISEQFLAPIFTTRQNYSFAFTAASNDTFFLQIAIPNPTDTVWIDNVMLQQATITPTNPDDYIVFQYNPGNTTKTFSLSGTYYDAKGASYSGNVTLQPYTSLVLFKPYLAPSSQPAQQSLFLTGNMVNAPAMSSPTNNQATQLTWKVDHQNSAASYYEVQRSSDDKTFTTIGRATVRTDNSTGTTYGYRDLAPLSGKNYYRILQHDTKDNVLATSQTVAIRNLAFSLTPNPAKEFIHLSFDHPVTASDHLNPEVQIYSASGILMQTVRLSLTDKVKRYDINVASLLQGTYILSVRSEGQTFSKTFIKQ